MIPLMRGVARPVARSALMHARCARPFSSTCSRRQASLPASLEISSEVTAALASKAPIVALESTIITHGLPYPANIEMASEVESIIRSEGVVPATMAFLDGKARVGLTSGELERLANTQNAIKVSRRDISYVLGRGLSGGTTISATMILAHMAGIKVFATGGLGGVHRGVAEHWDISADLEELGRTPVAVVCSGPKSILDIPKTIEYLETRGCHVSTFSPGGTPVNVPGFFTADSGIHSPYHFASPFEAAQIISQGTKFGLQSGYVFCVPAPAEIAMDQQVVNDAIKFALEQASKEQISGKATTPFLLKKVWEATGGDSVKTNIEFVKNNARMAARIARSVSNSEHGVVPDAASFLSDADMSGAGTGSLQTPQQPIATPLNSPVSPSPATPSLNPAPPLNHPSHAPFATPPHASDGFSMHVPPPSDTPPYGEPDASTSTRSIHMPTQLKPKARAKRVLRPALYEQSDVTVIGALSQDITCSLEAKEVSVSSYPGRITTSLGGTAHNVALAAGYSGAKTKLVSCIGDREEAEIAKTVSPVLDVSGVKVSAKERTSRYVCTNDGRGDLIVACADMDAVYNINPSFVKDEISRSQPEVIVFDGNLGPEQQAEILNSKRGSYDPLILFEPTSVPKAARLAEQKGLKLFPNASLDIATPNYLELMSMFEEFSYRERFDVENWFPIIDQLPLSDSFTRMKMDIFARSHPSLEKIVDSGLAQASFQLLPFIPNLFVTNGPNGVISFQLIENLKDRTGGIKGGPNSVYIVSRTKNYGVLIQHFPVEVEVAEEDAKSVNGIGDTFCGALVAQLAQSRSWLRDDGPLKKEVVQRAMHAASLSLQTYQAVNSEISTLFHPDN